MLGKVIIVEESWSKKRRKEEVGKKIRGYRGYRGDRESIKSLLN